jgi:hypothetical protein
VMAITKAWFSIRTGIESRLPSSAAPLTARAQDRESTRHCGRDSPPRWRV